MRNFDRDMSRKVAGYMEANGVKFSYRALLQSI